MKRAVWWIVAVVLGLATLLLGASTIVGIANCFGHPPGNDLGAAIGAAVFLAALTALAAWLTRVTEHHARFGAGLKAGARATTAYLPVSAVRSGRRQPPSRVRLHVSTGFFLLVWLASLTGFTYAAASGYAGWARTTETQSHGVRETAVVTRVITVGHTDRGGSWNTYNFDATLATPVHGHARTVVQTPDEVPVASPGQRIIVLVDPADPGYAELPGQGMGGVFAPIFFTVLALAEWAGTIWTVYRVIATRLRRRSSKATIGERAAASHY